MEHPDSECKRSMQVQGMNNFLGSVEISLIGNGDFGYNKHRFVFSDRKTKVNGFKVIMKNDNSRRIMREGVNNILIMIKLDLVGN